MTTKPTAIRRKQPLASGATRCNAKTRSGQPCKSLAMANGRCRMHGGATPKGIASPQFVTGRYSKYMPPRLLERYQEAADDPELLELRHEIMLVDARLGDLLKRVDNGEALTLWEKARKANIEIQKAVHDENYGRLMVQCVELDYLIGSGLADYAAWSEIQALLDQRRKLVESERKRLVEAQQLITSEQAMTLVSALLDSVRRNVPDRSALSAIQAEFISLVNRGN